MQQHHVFAFAGGGTPPPNMLPHMARPARAHGTYKGPAHNGPGGPTRAQGGPEGAQPPRGGQVFMNSLNKTNEKRPYEYVHIYVYTHIEDIYSGQTSEQRRCQPAIGQHGAHKKRHDDGRKRRERKNEKR